MLRGPLAAALLALQVSPPALIHAHPGGTVEGSHHGHSHAVANSHGHTHHSHARHDHSHGPRDERQSDRIDRIVPHCHLYLLGFEFTLPVSGDDPRSHDDGPNRFEAVSGRIVRLLDDAVTCSPGGWHEVESLVVLSAAFSAPAPSPAVQLPAGRTADAAWLCDSARHERSGVQLI